MKCIGLDLHVDFTMMVQITRNKELRYVGSISNTVLLFRLYYSVFHHKSDLVSVYAPGQLMSNISILDIDIINNCITSFRL